MVDRLDLYGDIFFFKQKAAYEISACLVGSEMCIRDSSRLDPPQGVDVIDTDVDWVAPAAYPDP